MKLKVGDRIRVLKILNKGQEYNKQVCETLPNNTDLCPGVFINAPNGTKINLAINLMQAKHVATLVVTKIKNQQILNS